MNNETEEVLRRIELTLKSGKNEIIFRKNELDLNPAKQSVIDWLESLKVITTGMTSPVGMLDVNLLGWSDFSSNNALPSSKTKISELQEKIDKMDCQIFITIDAKRFFALSSSQKLMWRDNRLLFNGNEMKFTQNKNPYCLIQTLFKDPIKLWNYDEIAEDWGVEYRKNSWQKYYQAAHSVNQTIAKETGIKGFLISSSKTVQINLLYLEK